LLARPVRDAYWAAVSVRHLSATVLPEGDDVRDLWVVDDRLTFESQPDAEELAAAGGFVLPGLVDCHSHPSMDFSGRNLPFGDTELVASNLRDHLRAGELLIREIGSAVHSWSVPEGTEMPRIQRSGRFLAPRDRYFPILDGYTEPNEAVTVAIAQVESGVRWVKLIADWPGQDGFTLNYPPEVLAAVVAAVHERNARVSVHAPSAIGARAAVEAGVDSVEHGNMTPAGVLASMAERGTALIPTVAFIEGFAVQAAGTPMGDGIAEALANTRSVLVTAERLGVPVLAGTDALPFGSVPLEIDALVRHGLEPATALAAATTAARAFLGEPGLDEGAPADLLVYRHDPREDPALLRSPEIVMFGGRLVR
jgi:imidazolonepropionase-like amidohydrolase